MFCGCELSFGEPPNTRTCPVCLGLPGALPVTNARGGPLRADDRPGARLRDRAALDLPPQELLLSRPAQGVPDLPVRRSRCAAAGGWATSRIHRVHLEEDAAKLVHVGESGRIHGADAASSTSTAAARRWWRSSPSPTSARAEQAREWLGLLRDDAAPARGVSDVNMEEGSLRSTPTSRPPGGRATELGHEDRAEEHELLPLPGARRRRGDRAPDRDAARRGDGVAGDAALRPRDRAR